MKRRTAWVPQCQKPRGLLGRFVLWTMNSSHSRLTDWALSHVSIGNSDTILDVGCGGGRTIAKLAALASEGKVYGVDYSQDSVAFARKTNRERVTTGRVEIEEASVSQLPFSDNMFDVVTAVETHFWWPDLPAGMKEILRVLKPGGTLAIVAEIYKQGNSRKSEFVEKHIALSGMKLLTVDEHRELFANAGYLDIQVTAEPSKTWICCTGRKPI
ncbi:MAG TPA: class I SAM-dependent methyltransferase [Candidatus Angelobacter sp.]|jgi:ubiquinone/menaquinone biosynthesis C-methylase UbiE|nr:class I SAM-dependent methyltransferase [Candidatus Angelobacter sp.]